MPITLNCPKCHKPFRVRDESVGGRVRCPTCGAVLQVPSQLSPASFTGLDQPPQDDPAENVVTQRPMADELSNFGSVDNLPGGNPGRPGTGEGAEPADTALPAPPSIKFRGPLPSMQPPASPPPPKSGPSGGFSGPLLAPTPIPAANMKLPQAPPPPMRPVPVPTQPPKHPMPPRPPQLGQVPLLPPQPQQQLKPVPFQNDETVQWRKVRSGLRMIRYGLFLWLIPILASVGHVAWWVFQPVAATKDNAPGFLKIDNLLMWQEWVIAYTAIPITLAVLLLFFGRLRCAKAPAESHARGLIRVAAFCTLIAAMAGVVGIATLIPGLAAKYDLPSQVGPTAWLIYGPTALMADICTLLFIGQIGWSVGRPQLQKSVASLFGFALFAPALFAIANVYYAMIGPVAASLEETGNPLAGGPEDDLTRRTLVLCVVGITMVILLFLRYASVAGSARRAIRQHLGE